MKDKGPDLYVINQPMDDSEKKEFSAFIKKYKKNHKIKLPRLTNLSVHEQKVKYRKAETTGGLLAEPEPDLYVIRQPLTKKDKEEISAVISKSKKRTRRKTKDSTGKKK